jgi:hypothetical protein
MTGRTRISTLGIVVPPVWTHVFFSTARLLQHALEDLGTSARVVEYDGQLDDDFHIVLGWSLFDAPFPAGSRYAIYQLEPLGLPLWRDRLSEKRFLFEQASAVWDYSELNIGAAGGPPAQWVPLGYHPRQRQIPPSSDIPQHDVLFVGFGSPRRRLLLERLSTCCLVSAQPRWGQELLAAMATTKIVLNVHQYDEPTPLEQPRVADALNQGLFVLSESSADNPYPELATAAYSELIERALYYLRHPAERRKEQHAMCSAFASTSMTDTLRRALDRTLGE